MDREYQEAMRREQQQQQQHAREMETEHLRDQLSEAVAQLAAANAQRDELLHDLGVAVQMLREANDRSAKPDEKRGLCSSAFCNGNHHDSACEGDYMTSRWIESTSEAIARAQSGHPAHHDECACEDCLQRDDEQPASGGGS